MGHWLACLWYAIGMTGSCQDGVLKNTSWLVNLGKELGEPLVFNETCNVQQMPDSSKCNQSLYLESFEAGISSSSSFNFLVSLPQGNAEGFSTPRRGALEF